jgi:hypothetical protein
MASPFDIEENAAPIGPAGGLADKTLGGLTKFMTNVNKGIERVLTNPLYERAWSGMVSGMSGDPMAGPLAVQQLRQNAMSQEMQRREMKAMEESPTQRAIRESEENARMHRLRLDERLRGTPVSDPNFREAWAQRYPLAYGKQQFGAQKAGARPVQVMRNGQPTYVSPEDAIGMEPVPRAPLVTVGDNGLDLNQIAGTSRAERASFVEQMKPFEAYDRARATITNVRSMADARGVLPQQASQIIASDVMAALRPEALNEGDVARLTAVGLWNKALSAVGLPPEMTVAQLDTLARMVEDKAKQAEPKRRALIDDGRYRAEQFGFDPRLIIGDYAVPQRQAPASRVVPGGSDPRFPRIEP